MKTKLHLKAVSLFTEHSYVQHPWLTIEDENGAIWRMLESFTKDIEYYRNHFVIACIDENENPVFLGYNDNKFHVGSAASSCGDAKKHKLLRDITIRL
jgi:hypothetical protein